MTKSRHQVFTSRHMARMEEIIPDVCADSGADLWGFTGEPDHVHLPVTFPTAITISRLVTSLTGMPSRRLRPEFPKLRRHHWRAKRLWPGSYFAGSVGDTPLTAARQYIDQQNHPS